MNHQDLIDLSNASSAIKRLWDMHSQFLEILNKHPAPADVPTSIVINGNTITIDCFGQQASAVPRTIRSSDDKFLIEYKFLVAVGDKSICVCRISMNEYGELFEEADDKRICDCKNMYTSKNVSARVLKAALGSELFSPSE